MPQPKFASQTAGLCSLPTGVRLRLHCMQPFGSNISPSMMRQRRFRLEAGTFCFEIPYLQLVISCGEQYPGHGGQGVLICNDGSHPLSIGQVQCYTCRHAHCPTECSNKGTAAAAVRHLSKGVGCFSCQGVKVHAITLVCMCSCACKFCLHVCSI